MPSASTRFASDVAPFHPDRDGPCAGCTTCRPDATSRARGAQRRRSSHVHRLPAPGCAGSARPVRWGRWVVHVVHASPPDATQEVRV